MKEFRVTIYFILAMLCLFSIPNETLATEKVVTLKFGTHWPKAHVMTVIMESWMKDIETRTGGRVKIMYFPADQLLSLKNALEKISSGVVEMGVMSVEFYPSQLPLIGVHGLPFTYANSKHGTKVVNELIDLFNQEFEANKLKLLWGFTTPPYQPCFVKKPVRTLEAWKGLRLRSGGRTQTETLQALGAIPVVVHTGELFTSMQRGILDGGLFPLSAADAFKLGEIIKHVTIAPVTSTAMVLCMNLNTWKNLSKEIQGKIMDASAVAAEKAGVHYDEGETKTFSTWEKGGVKFDTPPFTELALWRSTIRPIWDKWINEHEEKGLPAKRIAEEVMKRAEKYK